MVVLALLLVAAVAVVVITSGGDGGEGGGADIGGAGGSSSSAPGQAQGTARGSGGTAPPAAPGTDVTLLDGRLVVATRPGWQQLDASADVATLRLALTEPSAGELVSTFIATALPEAASLDRVLAVISGTPFEVTTSAGPLRAVASPGVAALVVAGIVRPNGTFSFTLSIASLDGVVLDPALLQKVFIEQVVPQLRFP